MISLKIITSLLMMTFFISHTSKLITCYIDNFALGTKSQYIAYLSNGSEHVHWILRLEVEVHSI